MILKIIQRMCAITLKPGATVTVNRAVPKTSFRPRQGKAELTVLSVSEALSLGRPADKLILHSPSHYPRQNGRYILFVPPLRVTRGILWTKSSSRIWKYLHIMES